MYFFKRSFIADFFSALALALVFCGCASSASSDTAVVLTDLEAEEAAESPSVAVEVASEALASVEAKAPEPEEPEERLIVVHVCGAVEREGVYTLPHGSRVYEGVMAAGGFSADADESYVNQAEVLSDGVKLRIPTREETAGQAMVSELIQSGVTSAGAKCDNSKAQGKININTADSEALCTLSGVGPSTAAKIIAYRDSNGGFKRIEDIMLVSGIKEKLFEKIKDSITV